MGETASVGTSSGSDSFIFETTSIEVQQVEGVQRSTMDPSVALTIGGTYGSSGEEDDDSLEPELDEPTTEVVIKSIFDLLARVELLAIEGAEAHVRVAEVRMDSLTEEIKAEMDLRIEKMEASLEKQQDAAKGGKVGKVFSWIAVAVTCVTAVAVAVATFGAAAPASAMAIAGVVGLVTSAGLTLTYQISADTGGWMQKGMTAMCGGNELAGMIVFMSVVFVLSMGGAAAGMKGLKATVDAAATQKVADAASKGTTISYTSARAEVMTEIAKGPAQRALNYATAGNLGLQVVGAGSSVYVAVLMYRKDMAAADLAEAQAHLTKLQEILALMRQSLNDAILAAMGAVQNNGGESAMKIMEDALIGLFRV
jgi:Secretion system effector C (SseC) like family